MRMKFVLTTGRLSDMFLGLKSLSCTPANETLRMFGTTEVLEAVVKQSQR